jgi:sugar diacid utilization regulator
MDMLDTLRKQELLDMIDAHLRSTARQMVQFDTLDETLSYLIDSFIERFGCSYMSIVFLQHGLLEIKSKKGDAAILESVFPLAREACLPRLFQEPLYTFDIIREQDACALLNALDRERFQTWFTIPIVTADNDCLGLCVIGFRSFVPLLLDAEKLFQEYGRDIANAISLARQKEADLEKLRGLTWLRENAFREGEPLEQLVGGIVQRAGEGTGADSAYIYLYDEKTNCLLHQPPSYGDQYAPPRIDLQDTYDLNQLFPYLEKTGGDEITIPLVVDVKTIGVLHVTKSGSVFTSNHLDLLQFLASHVSVLIENARLFAIEKEHKTRLENFMERQHEMVRITVREEGFSEITQYLSNMLDCSVLLFDRFLRLSTSVVLPRDEPLLDALLEKVKEQRRELMRSPHGEWWMDVDGRSEFGLWRVVGAGESLGYVGIRMDRKHLDMVLRMTVNHALNVFAVQFIKQKWMLDAREQAKESFFNQLLTENVADRAKILEYAHLLNWNLLEPHALVMFHFELAEEDLATINLFEAETKRNRCWDRIRDHVDRMMPGVVLGRKDGNYLAMIPEEKMSPGFWDRFYERITRTVRLEDDRVRIRIGISETAKSIEDYFTCYNQAKKALTILLNRYPDRGYLSFRDLGSYAVLYHLADPGAARLFMKTQLDPLLAPGGGKHGELFETLRVYLQTNGNIKETSERLFIHRSSLKYRLEKIRELLQRDLDDAEQRFNLMLAYKLYDLYRLDLSGE